MARLDLFLKNSGLFKQRRAARRACQAGQVSVDGRPAKSSREVRVGEILSIALPGRYLEVQILDLPARPVPRKDRERCCRIIRSEGLEPEAAEEVFGFDEDLSL